MSVDPRSLLAALLVAAGIGAVGVSVVSGSGLPADPGDRTTVLTGTSPGWEAPSPVTSVVPAPTWIALPSIHTRSRLLRLGLAEDGTMEVPSMAQAGLAGWYTHSPAPGAVGPAVIVGHVDSTTGPAVFYRLSSLRPGDRIEVGRADGTTAVFRVTRLERYPKDLFPTDAVYGDTTVPELRLITCGGTYEHGRGYLDNLVVYAELTT